MTQMTKEQISDKLAAEFVTVIDQLALKHRLPVQDRIDIFTRLAAAFHYRAIHLEVRDTANDE